jgi:hypothetical protein
MPLCTVLDLCVRWHLDLTGTEISFRHLSSQNFAYVYGFRILSTIATKLHHEPVTSSWIIYYLNNWSTSLLIKIAGNVTDWLINEKQQGCGKSTSYEVPHTAIIIHSYVTFIFLSITFEQSQSHIATDGQSISLGVKPILGPMTRYLLLFDSYGHVIAGRPLWRKDGSVFCQSHCLQ